MKYVDLLNFVKANRQDAERFYLNNGPNKHAQENDTGVQVVSWNLDLLDAWLEIEGEVTPGLYEAWNQSDAAQQRAVWELSLIHI